MMEISGIIPGSEERLSQAMDDSKHHHHVKQDHVLAGQSVLGFSGLIIGAYAVGRVLSLPLLAYLTKKDGLGELPYLAMTVFGICGNALYIVARAPWQLVVARAIKGMAGSIDYPNKYYMSSLFHGSERLQMFILAESATMAGLSTGPLVASLLTLLPWSSMVCVFSICGNVLFLSAIVVAFPKGRFPTVSAAQNLLVTQSASSVDAFPAARPLTAAGARDAFETLMLRGHHGMVAAGSGPQYTARARGVVSVILVGFLRNFVRLGFEAGFCSVAITQFHLSSTAAGYWLFAIVATGAPVNLVFRVVTTACKLGDVQVLRVTEPMALLACLWLFDAEWPGVMRAAAFLLGAFLLYPLNTVSAGACSSMVTKLAVPYDSSKRTSWACRDPSWWLARERLIIFDTLMGVSAGQLCGPWVIRAVLAHEGVTQNSLGCICFAAMVCQAMVAYLGLELLPEQVWTSPISSPASMSKVPSQPQKAEQEEFVRTSRSQSI
jgi:MFS family permease